MAFAPSSTYYNTGDSSILGAFRDKEYDNVFEFSNNLDNVDFARKEQYPHLVWVTNPIPRLDSGYRYARVLKTVAYVIVDEDDDGYPVIEKWDIKNRRTYEPLNS